MKCSKKKVEGFLERKEALGKVCTTDEIIKHSLSKYRRKYLAKN